MEVPQCDHDATVAIAATKKPCARPDVNAFITIIGITMNEENR
jgi:hypothetical protein